MKKKFYVYIYLDPRKPGKYKYEVENRILELDYEPIYVGKGKGIRYEQHWGISNHKNKFFGAKLRKIKKKNLIPEIFIRKGLTEEKAFGLEIALIKSIGRDGLKTGSLCNHTDGGEGPAGLIVTEKTRKKISNNSKKMWEDPTKRRNHSNFLKEMWKDPEYRSFMGEMTRTRWKDTEYRKKMIEVSKKTWKDLEYREKMAKMSTERYRDPKVMEEFIKRTKKLWKNEEMRTKISKKLSKKMKERFEDPEFKKRMGALSKKRWEDPEYKERMREIVKKEWANPESRRKRIQNIKFGLARRRKLKDQNVVKNIK